MKNLNTIGVLFITLILIISLNFYHFSDSLELKCVISDVDGKKYCVRDRKTLHESADMLAHTTANCKTLIDHLVEKYGDEKKCVYRLRTQFKANKVYEILPTSKFTAYSENKGEKLAFCLNTTKKGEERIDQNTLQFVAFHELAHIATMSVGHTEEFWRNFQFILKEAEELGIYQVVNYKDNPVEYCGMTINSSPYFRKNKEV
jgi:hypothetical protein